VLLLHSFDICVAGAALIGSSWCPRGHIGGEPVLLLHSFDICVAGAALVGSSW